MTTVSCLSAQVVSEFQWQLVQVFTCCCPICLPYSLKIHVLGMLGILVIHASDMLIIHASGMLVIHVSDMLAIHVSDMLVICAFDTLVICALSILLIRTLDMFSLHALDAHVLNAYTIPAQTEIAAAITQISTAPARRRARAHSFAVFPVVITSSTSNTRFPAIFPGCGTLNAPLM